MKRFAGEGFNLFNPFTYGNVGKAIEKTRSGDQDVESTDSPVGNTAKKANELNQILEKFRRGEL